MVSGSDSKTLMLVHVSPKEEDLCETICSLGFATRVKNIHLGSEEPKELKATKELAMAELLQKVKDFESESQDVKEEIERLNKKMNQLIGAEPQNEGNLEASHSSEERMQPGRDKEHNVRSSTRASENLPRFMRPTISSQIKRGLDRQNSLSASRKPPIPPKKRRPSSVYAESVTYTAKTVVWQSEQGSECSVSTLSQLNWNCNADDETEYSQETSEYEIKQVIFPEPEKFPRSLMTYLSHEDANELEAGQASKLSQMSNFAVDNWLQLDIKEQSGVYAPQNKQVLAIPTTNAENSSSHAKEDRNDFRKEPTLDETIDNRDEAVNAEELHKNMAFVNAQGLTVSSLPRMTKNRHHQNNNSDQRIRSVDEEKPELAISPNEIEASSEISPTEIGMPVSKENTFLNIYTEDLVGSTKHNEVIEEICLLTMRSRRSLSMVDDMTTLDQKCAALKDSAVSIATTEEGKHEKGRHRILGQTVQILWSCALLGLGIRGLGLKHDFFHGLMR